MTNNTLTRGLSMTAGIGAASVAAWLAISHTPDRDMHALIVVLAAITAFAAYLLPVMTRQNAWLATGAVIAILLGEGYALTQTAERLLAAREAKTLTVQTGNGETHLAQRRVTAAQAELDAALTREATERGKCGGRIGKAKCKALIAATGEARARLADAERATLQTPVVKSDALLAATTGISPVAIDLAMAAAPSIVLVLAQLVFFGFAHGPHPAPAETPKTKTAKPRKAAAKPRAKKAFESVGNITAFRRKAANTN